MEEKENKKSILQQLLDERGLTQSQFAEDVGLSRQTISKICTGNETAITAPTIEKICKTLGITPNELLGWTT